MELNQSNLDKMVQLVVPENYQPIGKTKDIYGAGKPPYVTGYTVLGKKAFAHKLTCHFTEDERKAQGQVYALAVNFGLLKLKFGDADWEKYHKYTHIFFNGAITEVGPLHLEFILLHEVGHADFHVRRKELSTLWKSSESELYADLFAAEEISKRRGKVFAKTVLKLYGSGWNKAQKENCYDA